MVNLFRFFLAIFVIAILVLQNSTENRLLRVLNKENIFLNQKSFNRLIWIFIVSFLIITFFADLLIKENINF